MNGPPPPGGKAAQASQALARLSPSGTGLLLPCSSDPSALCLVPATGQAGCLGISECVMVRRNLPHSRATGDSLAEHSGLVWPTLQKSQYSDAP